MVKLSIFCNRKPSYFIFNAFFLIFLINSMSLAIFAVDSKLPFNRLQITITLLLTSVMLKWTTNRNLPTISYLTSLDLYSIICILLLCLQSAYHAIVGSFWDKPTAIVIDKWILIGFSIIFILFNFCFVIWTARIYIKLAKYGKKEKRFLAQLKIE